MPFLKIARVKRGKFQTFSKITRVIYPKNNLNQTCDYWLITPNQETLCIKTSIFNSQQLQNNTVNGAVSITINRVIIISIQLSEMHGAGGLKRKQSELLNDD